MTKTSLMLTALLIPGIAVANAQLGDTAGTTDADIRAYLEAQGYVIEETETEGGMLEVEALLNGTAFEIEVDLSTGLVAEIEREDEDDDEDDEDDEDDDDDHEEGDDDDD